MPLALLAIPLASEQALPTQDPLLRQARLSCGGLETALKPDPDTLLDWPAGEVAAIACHSRAGTLELAAALVDQPIRTSKLITWNNSWREPDGATLMGRQDSVIEWSGQQLPARLESWSLSGRPRSVWILIWSDGAWRRPGFDAAWADLRSDLSGHRHSALLRLSIDAGSEDGSAAIKAVFAAAPPASMIGF